jgi:hypothetical protein
MISECGFGNKLKAYVIPFGLFHLILFQNLGMNLNLCSTFHNAIIGF